MKQRWYYLLENGGIYCCMDKGYQRPRKIGNEKFMGDLKVVGTSRSYKVLQRYYAEWKISEIQNMSKNAKGC